MIESSSELLLFFFTLFHAKSPLNTLDRSAHRSHIVAPSMMRTPSIVGSCLVAALLSVQLPASAQVPAEPPPPAAPLATPPAPAQPPPPPAAAPVVPSPQQVKPAPVAARKAAAEPEAEEDAAARQLAEQLEPTPGGVTADEIVQKTLANSPQLAKSTLEAD